MASKSNRPEKLKTPEEVLAELKANPGIDVTKQRPGTRILVETTQSIVQMVIENPADGFVRVSGTDQRLAGDPVGYFVQSIYDLDGKIALPNWIGKNLRMQIRFKNVTFQCAPALSAKIEGCDWGYDVF